MLNLKVRVKRGEITPRQALEMLAESAYDVDQALQSRTGRWLNSPNAEKRYRQGLKKVS